MNDGKILITIQSKDIIGQDGRALSGAVLVTKIHLAALSRAGTLEPHRTRFYPYVEEVHNFLTLSFADILSEARKYGLNLILAHQYGEQLDKRVQSVIIRNIGSLISFRLGLEDAELFAPALRPVFGHTELLNIPNHHICLKLMGSPHKRFARQLFGCPMLLGPTRWK
jgi:hypothetical protein